jgi:hypothetical protein
MNKSPSLFSSSLPVPAHSPIQTKNQVQKTPPISHSALSFNAQNTQHFYPADSADDYGLDPASTYTHQGVPSSPNHSFSFHNSMSRSHSPAANASASFDAPPTSSLFDMVRSFFFPDVRQLTLTVLQPQFSGNTPSTPGAVSHSVHSSTAWSPSASLHSNNRQHSELSTPGARNVTVHFFWSPLQGIDLCFEFSFQRLTLILFYRMRLVPRWGSLSRTIMQIPQPCAFLVFRRNTRKTL